MVVVPEAGRGSGQFQKSVRMQAKQKNIFSKRSGKGSKIRVQKTEESSKAFKTKCAIEDSEK